MYVCMYVCMHACMHACMYVYMYVCRYVCMYVIPPKETDWGKYLHDSFELRSLFDQGLDASRRVTSY